MGSEMCIRDRMIGTLLVIRAIVSRRHAGIFQEMAQASQQLLHR